MAWLVWRELVVMTRTRALWAALAAQIAISAAFLLLWGDGAPVLAGTVSDQFATIQFATFALVGPWVAARCSLGTRQQMTMLSVATALPPARLVAARVIALGVLLVGFASSTAPFALIAVQISALPASSLAGNLPAIVALAAVVAAMTTVFMLAVESRLIAWLLGTGATLLFAVWMPESGTSIALLIGIAMLMTSISVVRAGRTLRYLEAESG